MGKLVWVSIHCDSKMDMTDLQAGESWRQSSNSTICYTQDQKKKKKNETETKIWIEKDGLDWKIV